MPPTTTQNLALSVSGSDQHAQAGQTLSVPLSARVVDLDRSLAPVSGQAIGWVVTSGGGSVSPQTGTTDASGQTSTSWTIGTTGTQTLEARTASNGATLSQTSQAFIDPPAIASVSVTPHTVTAYSGWTLPAYTVTVTPGIGTVDKSSAYTTTSRNENVVRTSTRDVPYAGPDSGSTYLVFQQGGKSDSLKVININHDTAAFYRAAPTDLNFSAAPDTAQFWYSQPIAGTYRGDSAVRAFQLYTFSSDKFGGPINSPNPVVCKARYTVTVEAGTLGPLHPATSPDQYPGCDPYTVYTFSLRLRASDIPSGQFGIHMTVCPLVEHPICDIRLVGLQ